MGTTIHWLLTDPAAAPYLATIGVCVVLAGFCFTMGVRSWLDAFR